MKPFDPTTHIENASAVFAGGKWPNFHDAIIYTLNLWRGDCRPEDDVWVMPVIEVSLCLDALEFPYVVDLRFHDCERIKLNAFDHNNMINWLEFTLEARGTYADGVTPLPPDIHVVFEGFEGDSCKLEFRCARVEALGRREVPEAPCR